MNIKEMIVWIVGLLLGAAILLSPAACTMNRHRLVAEAIEKGADPMAVKCAIESDIKDSNCAWVAARISQKQQDK